MRRVKRALKEVRKADVSWTVLQILNHVNLTSYGVDRAECLSGNETRIDWIQCSTCENRRHKKCIPGNRFCPLDGTMFSGTISSCTDFQSVVFSTYQSQ
ncbi:hypothetical protein Y032_0338g2944 [Ancylostoma ceylanicum]|uniref:Uncharacterized protein n=1 Tax=Ancylostoma ceylanicum TaxID=53326 RepID=A0A016RZ95_9BILA|nr:hypothetical protein Y032_0338g2944 [Ancylostoma ceylanicum]